MQVAEVLVVQHSSEAMHARLVCNLLKVNTLCRSAIVKSRGHCKAVFNTTHVERFALFGNWLHKHAGLVSTLELLPNPDKPDPYDCSPDYYGCRHEYGASMASIAPMAFRLYGATSGAESSRLPLQLSHLVITGDFMADAALLSALSNVAVDRLDVEIHSLNHPRTAPARAAHCRALGTITSLRQLELISTLPQPPDIIAALQPLTRLTKLGTTVDPALAVWLPASLRSLDVTIPLTILGQDDEFAIQSLYGYQAENSSAAGADSPVEFNLSHLTALTSLVLRSDAKGQRKAITTKLPRHLDLLAVFGAFEVHGLQSLGNADIYATAKDDLCILQQLDELQEPWGLMLDMDFAPPRPASLYNPWVDNWEPPWAYVDPRETWSLQSSALQVAAAGLGACTQLTSLFVREGFRSWGLPPAVLAASGIRDDSPLCRAMASLPRLQEICIEGITPATRDLSHLAALPSLHRLTLSGLGLQDGPDTFGLLARLLLRPRGLKVPLTELKYWACRLHCAAVVPGHLLNMQWHMEPDAVLRYISPGPAGATTGSESLWCRAAVLGQDLTGPNS